jgi:hypothetical protein
MVDFRSLTNQSDAKYFPDNNGVLGWMDFTGYDVFVKPGGTKAKPDKLIAKNAVGKKAKCPDSDKQDMAWLADINALSGGAASRTDIRDNPSPPTDVLSRFYLTEGDLWIQAHAAEDGVVRLYKFAAEPDAALAAASIYSVKASPPIAILSLEKAGQNPIPVSLKLPATVVITHVDPGNTGTVQDHFDAFYNLLLGGDRPAPTDTGHCPGSRKPVDNEPRRPCPQAVLRLP